MTKRLLFLSFVLFFCLQVAAQNKTGHSFPKKWVFLERDTSGYVIYRPCEGRIANLKINGQYISLAWQLDYPERYKMTSIIKINHSRYIILAKNAYCNLSIIARWIDNRYNMALWKINRHFADKTMPGDDLKFVMCPVNKLKKIKIVKSLGNDTVKTPEMPFYQLI